MKTIFIDESMLGQKWQGTYEDLRALAEILSERLWRPVVASRSYGGYTRQDDDEDYEHPEDAIPEATWLAALAELSADRPGLWAR